MTMTRLAQSVKICTSSVIRSDASRLLVYGKHQPAPSPISSFSSTEWLCGLVKVSSPRTEYGNVMSTHSRSGLGFPIVLSTTFVGFCSFYGPQPLLPVIADHFEISAALSAWLLTLPFLCLAVGPVVLGSYLQKARVRVVLVIAMLLLGLSLLGFSLTDSFGLLLVFRIVQSLMLPVIFTASMTYASRVEDAELRRRRVALYISVTILGGFIGRIISGFVGEAYGWQAPFKLFAIFSLISAAGVWIFVKDVPIKGAALRLKEIWSVLQSSSIRSGLAVVFTVFFTFAGTLNAMPFRLVSLQPDIPASIISMVYIGYAVGIFIPLLLGGLINKAGGEVRLIWYAYVLLLIGLAGLAIPNTAMMFVVCFVVSSGHFTIHAAVSGYLNNLHADNASLVNGAYISNYYTAAAIGSILPLWITDQLGWTVYVVLQFVFGLTAIWHIRKLAAASG